MKPLATRMLIGCLVVVVISVPGSGQQPAGGLSISAWPGPWPADNLLDVRRSAVGSHDPAIQRAGMAAYSLLVATARTAAGQDELISILRNSRDDKTTGTACLALWSAGSFRIIPALLDIAENPALPTSNRQEVLEVVTFLVTGGFYVPETLQPVRGGCAEQELVDQVKQWMRDNQIEFTDEGYAHYWIRRFGRFSDLYEKARDWGSGHGAAYSLVLLDNSRESHILLPFLVAQLRNPAAVHVVDPNGKSQSSGLKVLLWMAFKHVRPSELECQEDEPLGKALVRWWETTGPAAVNPDGSPTLEELLRQGSTITSYTEYVAWANRVRLRSGKSIDLPALRELGNNSTAIDDPVNGLRWPSADIAQVIQTTGMLQAQYRLLFYSDLPAAANDDGVRPRD